MAEIDKRTQAGARFMYGMLSNEKETIDKKLAVYAQNRGSIPEGERPEEWAEETDRLLERRVWLAKVLASYEALI